MPSEAELATIAPPRSSVRWVGLVTSVTVSLLLAAACYAASIPFADFQLQSVMMGKDYETMSLDPLSGWGPHPERFLTPLIAWLVGLSGERYWMFSHGMLVTFLAFAHHLTFARSQNRVWATAFTYALSLSTLVGTYRGLVGYVDPTTFVLLCVCIRWFEKPWIVWSCMSLCVLNHGQTLFLFPWVVFERWRVARLRRLDAVLGMFAIAAYFVAHALLTTDDPARAANSVSGGSLSFAYYLGAMDWTKALELWIFVVPCAVFSYGFALIVLLWDLVGRDRRRSLQAVAVLLVSVCVMLAIAIDIFRFVPLIGFPMIAAMHRRIDPDRRACVVLVVAVVLTLAIRQWQLDQVSWLMDRLVEFAFQGHKNPTVTGLVPHHWPTFLGYLSFAVLLTVIARASLPRGGVGAVPVAAVGASR